MRRYVLAVVAALFLLAPALAQAQVPGIRVEIAPPAPRVTPASSSSNSDVSTVPTVLGSRDSA